MRPRNTGIAPGPTYRAGVGSVTAPPHRPDGIGDLPRFQNIRRPRTGAGLVQEISQAR